LFEKMLVAFSLKSKSDFWFKIIPPNYLYKKNTLRIVERNGFMLHLDLHETFDHGVYFREYDPSFETVLPELKDGDCIVDIGANIGYTALLFASQAKNCNVIAFEPHPVTFQKAQKNILLNPGLSIQLLNMGLGSKKDKLQLSEVNEANSGMNRILPADSASGFRSAIVEIERLDDVLKQKNISKVDFIKIDVEGYEAQVLAGAKDTLASSQPVILMELDDNNLRDNLSTAAEVIQTLRSAGYTNIINAASKQLITDQTSLTNCHWDIICKAG
jgi:FkbM family methyltransferase